VFAKGLTTIVDPVNAPGSQENDVAPDPVSVVDWPAHIVFDEAVAVTEVFGLTTTFTVLEALHPIASVPVTV
jgi:hypothetical protein